MVNTEAPECQIYQGNVPNVCDLHICYRKAKKILQVIAIFIEKKNNNINFIYFVGKTFRVIRAELISYRT